MFAFAGGFSKTVVGGVFNGKGDGVYALEVNPADGSMVQVDVAPLPDPTFLAVLPSRRLLYAASHSVWFEGQAGAGVTAFAIASDGKLTRLNSQRIPHPHVTMIATDLSERFLLAVSSLGGAISVLPLEADGQLGPISDVVQMEGKVMIGVGETPQPQRAGLADLTITRRPEFGNTNIPHCICQALDGDWMLVADYGASGIAVLGFDSDKGAFTQRKRFPLGRRATPRMLALHPNKRTFYSVNELESTVSAYYLNSISGSVVEFQCQSTLPAGVDAQNTASGIAIHPSGRFLWASNRGHDSVSTFTADREGMLKFAANVPSGGHFPWNLTVTPDGRWLYAANTLSGTLAAFAINGDDGVLTPGAVTHLPATSSVFIA
jgi:6-phosphogluconolactonase